MSQSPYDNDKILANKQSSGMKTRDTTKIYHTTAGGSSLRQKQETWKQSSRFGLCIYYICPSLPLRHMNKVIIITHSQYPATLAALPSSSVLLLRRLTSKCSTKHMSRADCLWCHNRSFSCNRVASYIEADTEFLTREFKLIADRRIILWESANQLLFLLYSSCCSHDPVAGARRIKISA